MSKQDYLKLAFISTNKILLNRAIPNFAQFNFNEFGFAELPTLLFVISHSCITFT